jgi:methylenetetrahydrofolate reductase (NADPH)
VSTTKLSLRERLATTDEFVTVTELVPWRGATADRAGRAGLAAARALVDDPRVAALSITDNAGGHAMAHPALIAEEFLARGQDVIVHVACRDRSRNGLLSLAWELERRGVRNVLAVSGDHPTEGFEGLSRPVFDVDSVGLLAFYRDLVNQGAGDAGAARDTSASRGASASRDSSATGDPAEPGFFLGCAVSPFKRLEAEVVPQYLKLALKVRAGADFVIPQLGYDARTWDELLRWMRRADLRVPALANVYVLSRTVARLFNANRIPGCVVSDELLAVAEREAAAADKGRAFFLELAARQVAIARGLGFRGVYLAGNLPAADVARVLDTAAGYAPDDWRMFAREIAYTQSGSFRFFAGDRATGLATDELAPAYARTLTPRTRGRARRRVSPWYKANRMAHRAVFAPGTPGFRAAGRVYGQLERVHLGRPLHVLEQAVKVPLYDCRDCGDCSLPDVAYLCPESQCPKGERNGPCGGSLDGICEVLPRRCVWVRAYERLKPYGEELTMLERAPVIVDNRLRRTSAWANTFLERDHFAKGNP